MTGLKFLPALRAENTPNKKTLKQAWRFFLLGYLFVIATGFEPVTVCLEGRCSIQLSYATLALKNKPHVLEKGTFHKPTELHLMSGWQDSNLRPPAPKAGAITGLRYTP